MLCRLTALCIGRFFFSGREQRIEKKCVNVSVTCWSTTIVSVWLFGESI